MSTFQPPDEYDEVTHQEAMRERGPLPTRPKPSRTEEAVGIMAKIYDARTAMRALWGDEYQARIQQWRAALVEIQNTHRVNLLEAGIRYLKTAQENNASGATQAMIMAAIVEESEKGK